MQDIEAIGELLRHPHRIIITTHQNPDADAMGSSLGLAGYLRQKGHSVQVITPTAYPQNLYWMPGNDGVIAFEEKNRTQVEQLINEADTIFCLDFSDLDRIRDMAPIVRQAAARKVMIDHHLEPEAFADLAYWDPTAASTTQLIYQLITALHEGDLVNTDVAACLYAGLMTDTGSFRHSNTTPAVHRMAAELLERGIDVSSIHRAIFDGVSIDKLRLLGYVLNEKLRVLPEYQFAYITLSADELRQYRSKTGDTEGLVNYALSVEGVRAAAILIDRGDEIRLSFRSVGSFSVRDLVSTHFNGGGHKNAAGGRSKLPLAEVEAKLLSLLPDYQEELIDSSMFKV
ncbi:DHH family phosphoesterase [Fibrella aquatilis]|uniref:Bifunctional oligoribonuclease/PAP phosphatase NrnA n=1 Tax=Fibrella aquatilis TaxID=2817059 RepID=A0A939K2B6_9BACT|nr:bifunctional oligoribonuclease/PAP phosphatase NrnA [Fibrella aquatilis]MBO0934388.1 bifunctional oligoribonuclease/PAP phosphatase NrnA [Fibrella aquatilis]